MQNEQCRDNIIKKTCAINQPIIELDKRVLIFDWCGSIGFVPETRSVLPTEVLVQRVQYLRKRIYIEDPYGSEPGYRSISFLNAHPVHDRFHPCAA